MCGMPKCRLGYSKGGTLKTEKFVYMFVVYMSYMFVVYMYYTILIS